MILDNKLIEQAFAAGNDAPATVRLQSQQQALGHLRGILDDPAGVRVLCGPAGSGKSTIVQCLGEDMPGDAAVALVDGAGSTGHGLLSRILSQFGYRVDLQSAEELLKMFNVFAVQQTRSVQPPVVVIENAEKMQIGALRALALIASLRYQGTYAVRVALAGGPRLLSVLQSKSLAPVYQRLGTVFELEPLSPMESMRLLHGRLSACGIGLPDEVLPIDVCDRLHELSRGLPGLLLDNARAIVARADRLPVSEDDVLRHRDLGRNQPDMPRLIVTANGKIIEEYEIREAKVTIGRSNIADIVIYNEFASKFHAMLILYSDALILVDLNSANGTFVNSVKVGSTILRSDDIISLASYRIKVVDAPEASSERLGDVIGTDTSRMRTLEEARAEKRKKLQDFLIRERQQG